MADEQLPALPESKEVIIAGRVRAWFDDNLTDFLSEGLLLLKTAGKEDAPRVAIWNKMCDKLLPDRKETASKGGSQVLVQINNVNRGGKTETQAKVIDG